MRTQTVLPASVEWPEREINTPEHLLQVVGSMGYRCLWRARLAHFPEMDVDMITFCHLVPGDNERAVIKNATGMQSKVCTSNLLGLVSGVFTTKQRAKEYARKVEQTLLARQQA